MMACLRKERSKLDERALHKTSSLALEMLAKVQLSASIRGRGCGDSSAAESGGC